MRKPIRRRFVIETICSAVTGALAVVTLVWRDWIEGVFGVSPDAHNGALEWSLVVVLALASVVLTLVARFEWRHAALAQGSHSSG
jgi:hypothetical protein